MPAILTAGAIFGLLPFVAPAGASVPAPYRRAIDGAPLSDLVLDGRGRAYASNTGRNQVEVVNVGAGALEAPIPVGVQPTEMDITADGNTLVVANAGGDDISVVDLAARREVRRVALPDPAQDPGAKVVALAVASNGTALVATQAPLSALADRLLQIDLATGTVRDRADARALGLVASGDHTKIVVAPDLLAVGSMRLYDAATDTFGPPRATNIEFDRIAVDQAATTILVQSENAVASSLNLFDGALVRRATLAPAGYAYALSADGAKAYAAAGNSLWVVDVARGLLAASSTLTDWAPETARMAVTGDGSTAVVLTTTGLLFFPLATVLPVRPCQPLVRPSGVTATCDPLADVVVDGAGHAFATDPDRNRVEVVNLNTGTLEAPIPVGSQPHGIDLSADGRLLYVANAGAQEISVIDVAERREVRRITVAAPSYDDGVYSIAVAANGKALYTTTSRYPGSSGHVVELDLATGATAARDDVGLISGHAVVRASGDRTRTVLADGTSGGPLRMYTAATGTFSAPARQDNYPSYVAVDADGDRLLVDGDARVVDGETLATVAAIGGGGRGVAITADGRTGYRVQDASVETLDLETATTVRAAALPDATTNAGAVAVSPDGSTLAVLTNHGVVAVRAGSGTAPLGGPYSVWAQPAPALDGVGTWIGIVNNPAAAAGQSQPQLLYGSYFALTGGPSLGAVGLVTEPSGRFAVFSIPGAGGAPQVAAVPFNWRADGYYYLLVYEVAPGTLGAWVYDNAAAAWTGIGLLNVPAAWGKLAPSTVTGVSWYGPSAASCSAYPRADVVVYPPTGYVGATTTSAALVAEGTNPGVCAVQARLDPTGWTRYRVGA